jgi:hypothetical protein
VEQRSLQQWHEWRLLVQLRSDRRSWHVRLVVCRPGRRNAARPGTKARDRRRFRLRESFVLCGWQNPDLWSGARTGLARRSAVGARTTGLHRRRAGARGVRRRLRRWLRHAVSVARRTKVGQSCRSCPFCHVKFMSIERITISVPAATASRINKAAGEDLRARREPSYFPITALTAATRAALPTLRSVPIGRRRKYQCTVCVYVAPAAIEV